VARYGIEDMRRFAEWLETPRAVRAARRLPTSRAAYAKKYKITDRTLRRWENESEEFAKLRLEARKMWELAGTDTPLEDLPETPGVPELSEDERAFDEIRDNLLSLAREGDPKALELYMRHFGKDIAERRRAAAERGLIEMSDDELVDRTLRLIGRERVLVWLNAG